MGEIETARLILRPVLRDDLDALARIYARPEVGRYTSRTGRITWEQSEDIVEHSARLWEQYGYGPWTAIDKATGVIIGRVGLNLLADWPGPDKWEVGWELDPTFWGRGLATEGGRVGVQLGFEAAGLQRIISATLAQNRASRRVMEKCGLNYKGTLPYHGTELVWYAINRREWNERQGLPVAAPLVGSRTRFECPFCCRPVWKRPKRQVPSTLIERPPLDLGASTFRWVNCRTGARPEPQHFNAAHQRSRSARLKRRA